MTDAELRRARAALVRMLAADFPEAGIYRAQLDQATLRRHGSGCEIVVNRERAAPGTFDPDRPTRKLEVDALGHGKLWLLLHTHEGYLDDLELLEGRAFPDPDTLKVVTDG